MTDDTPTGKARKRHLGILLERLTSHADVVRHYLPQTTHNATLGLAAEAGVRDVLRMVLPKRLAVTSGFIRTVGGDLIVPTTRGNISPQTDILIYDASRACPLYGVEGVEVLAASDVLGVIEVKDSTAGESDLGPGPEAVPKAKVEGQPGASLSVSAHASTEGEAETRKDDGALDHIAKLARAAPHAFRGIVLIQGGNASSARSRMAHRNLTRLDVPHVVYCRAAVNTQDNTRKSYLAFHDYVANEVHFHVHGSDENAAVQALAGFLRVVTGFFAAQGLTSASISADLRPTVPSQTTSNVPSLTLNGNGPLASLYERVLNLPPKKTVTDVRHEERVKQFFDDIKGPTLRISSFPAVGRDAAGLPTAGKLLVAAWNGGSEECASLFTMLTSGNLTCAHVYANSKKATWVVPQEPIDAYLKRVCALDASFFVDQDDDSEALGAPGESQVHAPAEEHYGDPEKVG